MKYFFVTPADLMNLTDGQRIGWLAPDDNSDIVERAGYRTIEQQVREMQLAGERLQDWREAVYPADTDVSKLDPLPVFGDELQALERYRDLQSARERRRVALRLDAANAAEVAAEEALRASAPPPPPQRVVIVEPDKA